MIFRDIFWISLIIDKIRQIRECYISEHSNSMQTSRFRLLPDNSHQACLKYFRQLSQFSNSQKLTGIRMNTFCMPEGEQLQAFF